jgi:ribose 1,5-bisphosphokinase PhnN
MTESAKIARKNLIAEIARRHAADRAFVKSVAVKETTSTTDEHDAVIAEEFARLEKASVILG